MIATVHITPLGHSASIELPEDVVKRLGVGEGDTLTVTETPTGLHLTPLDEEFALQMKLAEQIMREDEEVLRKLAQ